MSAGVKDSGLIPVRSWIYRRVQVYTYFSKRVNPFSVLLNNKAVP